MTAPVILGRTKTRLLVRDAALKQRDYEFRWVAPVKFLIVMLLAAAGWGAVWALYVVATSW